MPKILIKPRWKAWENACIRKAFEEKIQHKVIAVALGKSLTSVSKKIRKLGLREQTTHCGRIKGRKNEAPWKEKTPQDIKKMETILQIYAPLYISQKGQMALERGCWTTAKPFSLKTFTKNPSKGFVQQDNANFSFSFPLDYILSKDLLPQERPRKKTSYDPLFVSLCHIEEWAASEGFHHIKKGYLQHGLSYWKDGQYFSKAQLLIHVNRLRLERNLQPLALFEEDGELGNETSNNASFLPEPRTTTPQDPLSNKMNTPLQDASG